MYNTTHLWVRVKVSLSWSDIFSDIGQTCPLLEESYGTISASPYCYEEASCSLDNVKKPSPLLLNHSHIPRTGLVDGCRCNCVCDYSVVFLEVDTLKIREKKNPEMLSTVVLIFMCYCVGAIKVHRVEMCKELFFKFVQCPIFFELIGNEVTSKSK